MNPLLIGAIGLACISLLWPEEEKPAEKETKKEPEEKAVERVEEPAPITTKILQSDETETEESEKPE